MDTRIGGAYRKVVSMPFKLNGYRQIRGGAVAIAWPIRVGQQGMGAMVDHLLGSKKHNQYWIGE